MGETLNFSKKVNGLEKEVDILQGNVCSYRNLSSEDIQRYTNIVKVPFDVLSQYLERFQ